MYNSLLNMNMLVKQKDDLIRKRDALIHKRDARIHKMENTLSWKITSPLRKIGNKFIIELPLNNS